MVAFGVLPVCLGMALYNRSKQGFENDIFGFSKDPWIGNIPIWVIYIICVLFVLAALIRLAYFNVTCEETQNENMDRKKYYFGLPVTSTALIFPSFLILRYAIADIWKYDISHLYFVVLVIVGILFIARFKITKPSNIMIYIMVAFGVVEFIVMLFFTSLRNDIFSFIRAILKFFK